MKTECCICGNYRRNNKWYAPSPKEREELLTQGKARTHGYCQPCMILHLKESGINYSRIKEIFKELDKDKEKNLE